MTNTEAKAIETKGKSFKRGVSNAYYLNAAAGLYIGFAPVSFEIKGEQYFGFMLPFAWALQVEGYSKQGRTIAELWEELDHISVALSLKEDKKRLCVFVEDMGAVFQAIRLSQNFPEVVAKGFNKPIKALHENGIEFRSLEDYRGQEEVAGFKPLNCTEPIGPQTELKAEEIIQINLNAMAIVDYISKHISIYDGIGKMALTMVGRLRGAIKHEMTKKENREATEQLFNLLKLSPQTYRECLKAMWGGFAYTPDTMAGAIFYNVQSYDENSAYLAQQYCQPYPMEIIKTYTMPGSITCESIRHGKFKGGTPILSIVHIVADGVEIGAHGIAFLKVSHMENLKGEIEHQGHLLSADHLECWLTNLDLLLLEALYKVKSLTITKAHVFRAALLPNSMIVKVLEKYQLKTRLKGDEAAEHSPEYMDAKSQIGAAFGVHAMDITKEGSEYYQNQWMTHKHGDKDIIREMNKKRGRFQWLPAGIFTAAWGRFNLCITVFNIVSKTTTSCLTNDTDSMYLVDETPEAKAIIDKYNARIRQQMVEATKERNKMGGNFKTEDWELQDSKGKLHSLGAFEYKGEYVRAKSLHAKCHLFEDKHGEYKLTLAGQPNKEGLAYIMEQGDPFAVFNPGLVIPKERTGRYLDVYMDCAKPVLLNFTDRDGKTCQILLKYTIARKAVAFSLSELPDF